MRFLEQVKAIISCKSLVIEVTPDLDEATRSKMNRALLRVIVLTDQAKQSQRHAWALNAKAKNALAAAKG